MYRSVALSTFTMCNHHQSYFQDFSSPQIEALVPLNKNSPSPLPSTLQPPLCFRSLWIGHSRYIIQVESYNIRPFLPGSFHLACLQVLCMLQHVVEFYFFSRLSDIPLWVCPHFVNPFIQWRTVGQRIFSHSGESGVGVRGQGWALCSVPVWPLAGHSASLSPIFFIFKCTCLSFST